MNKSQYTYCTVKYLHDPAVGEALNVGVLMCAPSQQFYQIRLESRFERLSEAFANFHGDRFRGLLRTLHNRVTRLAMDATDSLFPLMSNIETAVQLSSLAVPDQGLSLQFGPQLAGVASDLSDELDYLFERLVTSQYERKQRDRRTDQDVWAHFSHQLDKKHLIPHLKAKTFATRDYELKFDHAFKNGKWHVLEPVTMDYSRVQTIQDRAARILGDAVILDGNEEVGKLYLLLGKPELDSHKAAYERAKNLLNKIPVKKEIFEEDEARQLAEELAAYMKKNGLIPPNTIESI